MNSTGKNAGGPVVSQAPTIAMIGLEGCGKTVLATTLAKRLSTIDARGIFLNPQGVKTLRYVESVWSTLQSGEWPPSTPPGELFELSWKFEIIGELESDVKLVDTAGQDLRVLFGEERIQSIEELPAHLKSLAGYCRSAEIVLFLLNLKDYVGHGNPQLRAANEAAVKSAMDYLGSDPHRRVCLVFTQSDLYKALAQQSGGWLELAAQHVPYIFGAHLRMKQMAVYPVSAVAETRVELDSDGKPRRVPIAGFRSEGLDDLVVWLATQVRGAKVDLDLAAAVPPAPPVHNIMRACGEILHDLITGLPPLAPRFLVAIVVLFVGIVALRGCIAGFAGESDEITHVNDGLHFESGGDSAWTDVVNNTSETKTIMVKATVRKNAQAWTAVKAVTVSAHTQQHVDFWLPGADNTDPYVTCSIDVVGDKQ